MPVAPESRGEVDTEAASRHAALDATVERRAFGGGRVFLRAMAYGEDRENGTPLQVNDTRSGLGALGVDWGETQRGRGLVRLWAQTQVFHQTFSAVSADRSREDLTRTQRVPASTLGLSAQWGRLLGLRPRVLAGAEARPVQGTTEETAYVRGAPTNEVEAPCCPPSGCQCMYHFSFHFSKSQ